MPFFILQNCSDQTDFFSKRKQIICSTRSQGFRGVAKPTGPPGTVLWKALDFQENQSGRHLKKVDWGSSLQKSRFLIGFWNPIVPLFWNLFLTPLSTSGLNFVISCRQKGFFRVKTPWGGGGFLRLIYLINSGLNYCIIRNKSGVVLSRLEWMLSHYHASF